MKTWITNNPLFAILILVGIIVVIALIIRAVKNAKKISNTNNTNTNSNTSTPTNTSTNTSNVDTIEGTRISRINTTMRMGEVRSNTGARVIKADNH